MCQLSQAYPYTDSWTLSWPYRRSILLQELLQSRADLFALQEVQADHFEQDFKPFMESHGYDGIFKQKSRESMGQLGKVDGCAVFWLKSKFTLNETYVVDFNDCARRSAEAISLDDAETRRYMNRLSKDNIAQLVFLEVLVTRTANSSRPQRQLVCVANTHLYSNHQRPDVKLWQSLALVGEIERVVSRRDIPLMLCGDFNSEPDSAVYDFLAHGRLSLSYPDLKSPADEVNILPNLHNIKHGMELTSMMSMAMSGFSQSSTKEPPFTNFTSRFKGTLDYVFYTASRLRLIAASNIPAEDVLRSVNGEGLPSAQYPSDHLKLCGDFALIAGNGGMVGSSGSGRNPSMLGSALNSNGYLFNGSTGYAPSGLSRNQLGR